MLNLSPIPAEAPDFSPFFNGNNMEYRNGAYSMEDKKLDSPAVTSASKQNKPFPGHGHTTYTAVPHSY